MSGFEVPVDPRNGQSPAVSLPTETETFSPSLMDVIHELRQLRELLRLLEIRVDALERRRKIDGTRHL